MAGWQVLQSNSIKLHLRKPWTNREGAFLAAYFLCIAILLALIVYSGEELPTIVCRLIILLFVACPAIEALIKRDRVFDHQKRVIFPKMIRYDDVELVRVRTVKSIRNKEYLILVERRSAIAPTLILRAEEQLFASDIAKRISEVLGCSLIDKSQEIHFDLEQAVRRFGRISCTVALNLSSLICLAAYVCIVVLIQTTLLVPGQLTPAIFVLAATLFLISLLPLIGWGLNCNLLLKGEKQVCATPNLAWCTVFLGGMFYVIPLLFVASQISSVSHAAVFVFCIFFSPLLIGLYRLYSLAALAVQHSGSSI